MLKVRKFVVHEQAGAMLKSLLPRWQRLQSRLAELGQYCVHSRYLLRRLPLLMRVYVGIDQWLDIWLAIEIQQGHHFGPQSSLRESRNHLFDGLVLKSMVCCPWPHRGSATIDRPFSYESTTDKDGHLLHVVHATAHLTAPASLFHHD